MSRTRAILISLLLSACAATPGPYDHKVRMSKPVVRVLSMNESTAAGTLRVAVSAVPTAGGEQKLRYRVLWYDASGSPIESSVSSWQSRVLGDRQTFDFIAVAPAARAVSYIVEFERQ